MGESSGFTLRNMMTSTEKVKCKQWDQIYSEPGALPAASPLLLHPPGGVGGHLWCPSRLIPPSLLPACGAAIKSRSRRRRRRWEEAGSGGCLLCRQTAEWNGGKSTVAACRTVPLYWPCVWIRGRPSRTDKVKASRSICHLYFVN